MPDSKKPKTACKEINFVVKFENESKSGILSEPEIMDKNSVVKRSRNGATCTELVEKETGVQISAPEIPKFKSKEISSKSKILSYGLSRS